jgi:hypothetical protein
MADSISPLPGSGPSAQFANPLITANGASQTGEIRIGGVFSPLRLLPLLCIYAVTANDGSFMERFRKQREVRSRAHAA